MTGSDSVGRALLLPGSIGMGHHAMATAIGSSLRERGWETETLDVMQLLGSWEQWVGERVFRTMLAVPGLYDAVYFSSFRGGGWIPRRMEGGAASRIVPKLTAEIQRSRPDLVVSIFATAASAMAEVSRRVPGVRRLTFCTDLNPHRMWVHEGTDAYLVRSPASEEFVRRFDPEARVVVTPPPVRPAFYSAPDRDPAREALGIPPGEPCVLLMGGAWGLGPLVDVAAALTTAGVHALTVAGRNAKAEARLRAVARSDRRLHVFGFTDRIPDLMSAANVVITSPGETCSEARVVGRQLALLDVVAGHGRENLQFELQQGDTAVVSTQPDLLVRRVLHVLATTVDPPPALDRRTVWEAALDDVLR